MPVAALAAHPAQDVRVDLPGIVRRVAAFPVPEGRFGQIAGVAGNKVVWTAFPIPGAHGRGGHKETPGRLEMFDFGTQRTGTLVERVDRFALAADETTLVIRDGKRLRAVPANRKGEPALLRHAAERLGQLLQKELIVVGTEDPEALLSNAQRAFRLFGYPTIPVDRLLEGIAAWVQRGGEFLDKPTHFESRDGRF